MEKRVLVGFSGGVDSAMTALFLRDRGYAVHGAMMSVRGESREGCGSTGDVAAARALAEKLDIPLTVFDCSGEYRRNVLDHFRNEYLNGRTPNPCVVCNPRVKFAVLPAMAREAGVAFDRFATGHYARIVEKDGKPALLRGLDQTKDQSYFLYRLTGDQLAATIFPLGEMRKADIRAEAERRGVPVFDKPDSQDFYAGEYADLLGKDGEEGEIVHVSGKVLGRHDGYWHFTPGQRKGLGVAYSEPLYVVRVEPKANRVVVGTRDEQLRRGCVVGDLVFSGRMAVEGEELEGRLRSSQPLRPMRVEKMADGRMWIRFGEKLHGVAPGQSLVLYDGDMVVGGGVIEAALES